MDPAERLAEARATTTARLAALRADFAGIVAASESSNADDEHDPEGPTIAFERSQVDALVRQAEGRLAEVDAALERLRDGTYGVCVVCGRAIPAGRLEARPTTTVCVEHA
jgi:RNA polymerase-binding transcription factor DksA